jgi:hypothetical protein
MTIDALVRNWSLAYAADAAGGMLLGVRRLFLAAPTAAAPHTRQRPERMPRRA